MTSYLIFPLYTKMQHLPIYERLLQKCVNIERQKFEIRGGSDILVMRDSERGLRDGMISRHAIILNS
jgi:hypothetical protein